MCRLLGVTRQGYDKYKKSLEKEDKHAELLAQIEAIIEEDEFNDKYGRRRLCEALKYRGIEVSESTVYRVCKKHNLLQKANKPKGLTKQEKEAYKSDDLLKGDFEADEPGIKYVTDITQIQAKDGTVYISALFDCYDNICEGLSMSDNMKTPLVTYSIESTFVNRNPSKSAIVHSDRGSQYTSDAFRETLEKFGITQSMSHAGSSCFGNAKCESMWGRLKEEAIYGRYKTEEMIVEEVKSLVFRYYMGYWNHRRICSAIGGMPPVEKRRRFLEQKQKESVA
jgi:putative transposase